MPNPFIVLEGTHGAGKSSVAQSLRDHHGFHYVRTPPLGYDQIRQYVHDNASGISRFLFYMAGNVDAAKQIKELIKSGPVVCDRYINSTIAACNVDFGLSLSMLQSIVELMSEELMTPDKGFFLRASNKERLERLQPRIQREPLYKVNPDEKRISRLEDVHISLMNSENWTVIDTSGKTVQGVVKIILGSLRLDEFATRG